MNITGHVDNNYSVLKRSVLVWMWIAQKITLNDFVMSSTAYELHIGMLSALIILQNLAEYGVRILFTDDFWLVSRIIQCFSSYIEGQLFAA